MLVYVALKSFFMSLQFGWGVWSGNLGIVSASFHTGFDVLALCCSLGAMLLAKYPPKHPYSYGRDRGEVVAAFTNAIFLLFVATFMIIETFHTAYAPPAVETDDVVLAVMGLAMDAVGLALFIRYARLSGAEDAHLHAAGANPNAHIWATSGAGAAALASGTVALGSNGARGHYENMHGVSLHVIADVVGHGSLLSAVWLQQRFPQLTFLFALSFLLSAVLIVKLVLPLFTSTAAMLLMTTPAHLRLALDRAVREISFYDGVLELRAAHWWTHAPGQVVGSMHIRIRSDANEQQILSYVHAVLSKFCALLTVQVEKDQLPNNWTTQHAILSP